MRVGKLGDSESERERGKLSLKAIRVEEEVVRELGKRERREK